MRRLVLLSCAVLIASCKGLFIEHGNNYPCDFSEPPGTRDEVCQPGDICGLHNLCQKFIYEGPRFEGGATLPEYGPGITEGELLHPLALFGNVTRVVGNQPVKPDSLVFVTSDDTGLLEVQRGHVQPITAPLPLPPPVLGVVTQVQTFGDGGVPRVLFENAAGRLAVGTVGEMMARPLPFLFVGSRVLDFNPRVSATPVVWTANDLGFLVEPGDGGWEFERRLIDAGEVLDVAALSLSERSWVLMLYPDGIDALEVSADGGVTNLVLLDPINQATGSLKTDRNSRIVAAVRQNRSDVDVLSTFQVNVTSTGPVLTSPWPDCAPCREGRHIELVAPSVRTGFATVDVVCMPNTPTPPMRALGSLALRVYGSVALTQHEECITEDLEAPVAFDRVARTATGIVHWDSQWGLLVGGVNGEVWSGETITSIQPSFLDRVPLDVAPALAGRTPSIAVLAGDYLAIQQTAENKEDPNEQLNGFRRVPLQDLGAQRVDESTRLMGFVHGVGGWVVTGAGDLARANLGRGANKVAFGPRLVTSGQELIRDTIGGEAFTKVDGSALGFFLAADDSLYFVPDPEKFLYSDPDEYVTLPVLTPEPSVPIRSLALERTPLGTYFPTDGGSPQARGYLVTSRNLYAWELSGSPASWFSTPLDLTVGEPLEVWFDSKHSALGRVGYRDGQIYSLPGGYPLVAALKEGPHGEPSQVIDYENLGGWPVAYTTTGLFIAEWDLKPDGGLDNRFDGGVNKPMTWRLVTLPDRTEPWTDPPVDGGPEQQRAKPGKLFVTSDDVVEGGQAYRLLLFTDDEVRQVAHHVRSTTK